MSSANGNDSVITKKDEAVSLSDSFVSANDNWEDFYLSKIERVEER
ncbi:hypothetical protein GCM10010911_47890 [Paenibacillus nasutitermitis]|uniref:Uncharacterized protein n=1 Tax=Paenibacillus nasutitermitis TaxID=1652958 RepID=A0A917DZ73_9BACL|nr:hypothetical protein GCM10010911_47890 [Paenibacillus nasutitermitis]